MTIFRTALTILIVAYSALFAAPHSSRELLIKLEPLSVSDGKPTDIWLKQLQPLRDNDPSIQVKPLNLPTRASADPLFKRLFKISVPDGESVSEWINRLNATSGVEWVELPPVRWTCEIPHKTDPIDPPRRDAPPDDPYYPLQWSLEKINSTAGWDVTRGDTSVVIAVVDVGTDITHGDLRTQLWTNWAEKNGVEGVDDDENGFIDDVHGWNFFEDNADPNPNSDDAHGTHTAGIACASVDNSYGIAGSGWDCRLMAIRAGIGRSITNGYEGVLYAVDNGADIINLSWGSSTPSNIERITTEYAIEQGALIIAAAGNNRNSERHYPGAYEQVLAVAATESKDKFAYTYSSFGSWVGISAPGSNILSLKPGGFRVESGTSMATPLVAGVAGLIKSLHPDWSPEQIMLQLTMSADPVDEINPDHLGEIGSGRLNMFRALSDNLAGFELASVHVNDGVQGNENGILDPAEHALITVTLKNVLSQPAQLSGRLTTTNRYVNVDVNDFDFGTITSGGESDNSSDPYYVRVSRSSERNSSVIFDLNLTINDLIQQIIPIELPIAPSYDDHDTSEVTLTVTDFGALGYYDYLSDDGVGNGFIYRPSGLSALFHGSLMIGSPPNKVSDCAFGNVQSDTYDFYPLDQGFSIRSDGTGAQVGIATYEDGSAEQPLNVIVRQESYSYPNPPDDDYVIISYLITNDGTAVDSLYAGMYLDWDVVEPGSNLCYWNESEQYGWMGHTNDNHPIYGAAIIDQSTTFHSAIDNNDIHLISGTWSDQNKMEYMQSGFEHGNGDHEQDWSQLIGVGPIDIAENGSVTVTFALLAGDDLDDLTNNVHAARSKWNSEVASSNESLPQRLTLIAAYPAPFNSSVTVKCRTDIAGSLTWSLSDIAGRTVLSDQQLSVQAGEFSIKVAPPNLSSGRYVLTVKQEDQQLTLPITLIR